MQITEVGIKLMNGDDGERLLAFATIVFDNCFIVRDLKVIQGTQGSLFIAMPSRKLMDHCSCCRTKNHLKARFCNECGSKLGNAAIGADEDGRETLYADIAHPINHQARTTIQGIVLRVYDQVAANSSGLKETGDGTKIVSMSHAIIASDAHEFIPIETV